MKLIDKVVNMLLENDSSNYLLQMTKGAYEELMRDYENEFSDDLNNKLIISIVNIEEDRVAKTPENYIKENSLVRYKNPAIPINLTILFAATHNNYETAITLVEKVIRFFQIKYVFTPQNTPELQTINEVSNINIEKIIFDWVNLNLEQVNQLWSYLGGHYMPSVVMKMRMFTIDEQQIQKEGLPIKEINECSL